MTEAELVGDVRNMLTLPEMAERLQLLADFSPSEVPSRFSALSKQICALPDDTPGKMEIIHDARTFSKKFIITEFERASGTGRDKQDQQATVLTKGFEMAKLFPNDSAGAELLDFVCTKHLESLSSLPLSKQASSFFHLSERICVLRSEKKNELVDRAQKFAEELLTKMHALSRNERKSSLVYLSVAMKPFPNSHTRPSLRIRIDRELAQHEAHRMKSSGKRRSYASLLK